MAFSSANPVPVSCTHIVLIHRLEGKEAISLARVGCKLNNYRENHSDTLTSIEYFKKKYNFTSDSGVARSN